MEGGAADFATFLGRLQALIGTSTTVEVGMDNRFFGIQFNAALYNFDFLVSLGIGADGGQPVAHWTMPFGGAVQIARRLRNDPRYRAAVAEVLGIEVEDFIDTAKSALEQIRRPDSFGSSEAIRVLLEERS